MEEKKKKTTMKVVDRGGEAAEDQQKLSYEQLNSICADLYQQNQVLAKQLKEMNLTNMFKRLDYLFLVLKYENVICDPGFVGDCIAEIKDAIAIREPDKDSENGK